MILRTALCACALFLSACYNKQPQATVTPIPEEMEVEWRAE
jgi:hypothetical protein